MNSRVNHRTLIFIFFLVFSVSVNSDEPFTLKLGAESLYITEGRDNFDDRSLQYIELTRQISAMNVGFWHARSDDSDFYENNIILGREWVLNDSMGFFLHYTYLDFSNDSDDHEISLTMNFGNNTGLTALLSTVYSHQSAGIYSNMEVAYRASIHEFNISPFAGLGINSGYVANEHRGADHYIMGVRSSREFLNFLLSAHVSKTIPINKQPRDTLVNTEWVGIDVEYRF